MAIMSRDIVAAEGHFHRTCYRSYTKEDPVDIDEESAPLDAEAE